MTFGFGGGFGRFATRRSVLPFAQASEIARRGAGERVAGVGRIPPIRTPFSTRLLPGERIRPAELRGLPGRLLTVREVAALLQVSMAIVYRLCDRGELGHVRVSSAIRVPPAEVEAFIRAARVRR